MPGKSGNREEGRGSRARCARRAGAHPDVLPRAFLRLRSGGLEGPIRSSGLSVVFAGEFRRLGPTLETAFLKDRWDIRV